MKRLVADENFRRGILLGLVRRDPKIDAVNVVDIGLSGIKDPALLAWAATQGRIVLSHDRKTMKPLASARIEANERMAGLVLVTHTCRTRLAIEDILIALECYGDAGWENRVVDIPL